MSDDLVKRYSSYNIMMLGDSGNEVSTPDGEWVKYKDYHAQSARIEELEAKLEKAEWLLCDASVQLREGRIKTRRNRADLIDSLLAELKGETE